MKKIKKLARQLPDKEVIDLANKWLKKLKGANPHWKLAQE